MNGGCYSISMGQIFAIVKLQRLKLYNDLNGDLSAIHEVSDCCRSLFTDDELRFVNNALETTADEFSSLYFFYVAFKRTCRVLMSRNWI